jgi:hypothetical protein
MVKRLASLGLVAAGGAALAPLAAEAKPKRTGKKRDHGGGRGRNKRGGGPSARLELRNPPVIATILIPDVLTSDVLVTVAGNIIFDDEHLALMRQGRQFRLTCKVGEEDSDADELCFQFVNPDGTPAERIFSASSSILAFTRYFTFQNKVARSKLNKDDGVDEIYGELALWTRARAGLGWTIVTHILTLNRIDRAF